MQQEQLIEKVRQFKFLYNVHSAQYRNQNMRHEAWEEIGKDLKITASQAKNTWSKLRNCFSNALKRRNANKSGQAAKKYVPRKFEKQMAFLQPYMDSRQTHGNLSQTDTSLQLSEEESQMIEDNIDDEPNNTEENEGSEIGAEAGEHSCVPSLSSKAENTQSRPQHQQVPQRRKRSNPAEEIVEIMKKNSELRTQKASQKADNKFTNNLNETDMFYLSMSKIEQKLPQMDQIHIRMKLSKLVSEAEMRQLQTPRHNQTLTSPQPSLPQSAAVQPTSPSQIHSQPLIYHTLTPVQPNSLFQSQTLEPTEPQILPNENDSSIWR